MPLARVGGNGFMWTSYVLPRDARLSRDGRLANSTGGECDFLWVVSILTVFSRLLEW